MLLRTERFTVFLHLQFKIVGATYIAKYLYPEEMADVNPDDFFKEWLEDWQGVSYVSGHAAQLQ